MDTGLIGGIAGGALGLIGGSIGTYFSIKNTRGPRERAFMIKCSIVCWIAISLFLGLMFTLPAPYRHFLWIPYAILLPVGVAVGNREQSKIQKIESQNNSWDATGDKSST
jgi:hypothetical protein